MRKIAIVLLAALILIVVGIGLKLVLDRGFSTRDEPLAVENMIALRLRNLAVPRAHKEARNPVPLNPDVLERARAHFADHCAYCHGNDGRGNTTIGRNLYPKAPDMWSERTRSLPDGHLFYIVKNGVRLTGMPAWGQDTPEDDRQNWELVHFIRHLPNITPTELAQMEDLNPRSREEWQEQETEKRFLAGEDVLPTPPPSNLNQP